MYAMLILMNLTLGSFPIKNNNCCSSHKYVRENELLLSFRKMPIFTIRKQKLKENLYFTLSIFLCFQDNCLKERFIHKKYRIKYSSKFLSLITALYFQNAF